MGLTRNFHGKKKQEKKKRGGGLKFLRSKGGPRNFFGIIIVLHQATLTSVCERFLSE